MSLHFQESRETESDFFLEGAKRLFARKGGGKLELGRYRYSSRGGIGRRNGLKIRYSSECVGSSPSASTKP